MADHSQYDWRNFKDAPGFIAELPHTAAWLLPDQTYRGRTVVWVKEHFDDPADMPAGLLTSVMHEVIQVANAVRQELNPGRLNYTCFGNVAAHVHWHIIPRYEAGSDWGQAPRRENEVTLKDKEMKELAEKIAERLEGM